MTKSEALKEFRAEVLPAVRARFGKGDGPAESQAWNEYTDALCKGRRITLKQYESWTNPF